MMLMGWLAWIVHTLVAHIGVLVTVGVLVGVAVKVGHVELVPLTVSVYPVVPQPVVLVSLTTTTRLTPAGKLTE